MVKEWFAIYGTEQKSKDGKVRVATADFKSIKLGPNGTYQTLTTDGGDGVSPAWADASEKKTSAAGAFTIATDGTFTFPNPCKYGRPRAYRPDTEDRY